VDEEGCLRHDDEENDYVYPSYGSTCGCVKVKDNDLKSLGIR
jgi:hypothetical protein